MLYVGLGTTDDYFDFKISRVLFQQQNFIRFISEIENQPDCHFETHPQNNLPI